MSLKPSTSFFTLSAAFIVMAVVGRLLTHESYYWTAAFLAFSLVLFVMAVRYRRLRI